MVTSMNWKDVSVLLVGAGSIGRRHARVLTALGVKDIRICDPSPSQLGALVAESQKVRAVASFEAGLAEKPGAVFVLTPPKMHIAMSIAALDAGCAVFCEKPLADSTVEVPALAAKVVETGLPFMVGLCFRFHTGVLELKSLLDAGRIGRLVFIRATIGEHMPDMRPDYRTLFSAQYSGAFDCMHDIDLALWLAGRNPQSVRALYGNYSDIGIAAPDLVEVLLDFPDRVMGSVHLDFFQRPRTRTLELVGTEGKLELEYASWDSCTLSHYDSAPQSWSRKTMATRRDDMFADEDRAFLMAVSAGTAVSCTYEEAMRSIRVVEAAQI